jgi:hypothetical protein
MRFNRSDTTLRQGGEPVHLESFWLAGASSPPRPDAESIVCMGGFRPVDGRGKKLAASFARVTAAHVRLVSTPKERLSSLGYDTALLGAIAVSRHGVQGPSG